MMTHYFAHIVFKAMVSFVPLSQHSYYETAAETQTRYESIAEDISEGSDAAPIFQGTDGGIKTALLLASLSSFESAYRKDIDSCQRGGDHNRSWTIFQLLQYYSPKEEVCKDRKKAVEYAIKYIRNSFEHCNSLPVEDRLSVY